ncbi:nudix hydrolase protein [Trifolium repens]|nr:nudix hydrolase protein [Trifolium repens]
MKLWITFSCWKKKLWIQVSVQFSHAYDRIPHSDLTLENTISQIWEQTSVQNKSLFNGNKFRYGGQVLQTGGESDNEPHSEGTLERGASSRIYTLNSIRMGFILGIEQQKCEDSSIFKIPLASLRCNSFL